MAPEERQGKRKASEARPTIAPRVFRSEAKFKEIEDPGKVDKSYENIGLSGSPVCNRPNPTKHSTPKQTWPPFDAALPEKKAHAPHRRREMEQNQYVEFDGSR